MNDGTMCGISYNALCGLCAQLTFCSKRIIGLIFTVSQQTFIYSNGMHW